MAHNEPDEVVEVVPEDVPGEAVEPPSALDQDEPCSAFTELESTEPPKDVEAVADLDDTADNTAANLTSTHLHPPPSEVLMDTAAAIPTTTDGRDSKEVLVKAAPKPPSRLWRPRRLSQMAQPVEPPTEPTKRLRTAKASGEALLALSPPDFCRFQRLSAVSTPHPDDPYAIAGFFCPACGLLALWPSSPSCMVVLEGVDHRPCATNKGDTHSLQGHQHERPQPTCLEHKVGEPSLCWC